MYQAPDQAMVSEEKGNDFPQPAIAEPTDDNQVIQQSLDEPVDAQQVEVHDEHQPADNSNDEVVDEQQQPTDNGDDEGIDQQPVDNGDNEVAADNGDDEVATDNGQIVDQATFGDLSFSLALTLTFGDDPLHLYGIDNQNPHIFSALKLDTLAIFAMNNYAIGLPMESVRNFFVAYIFVNNKLGTAELVTIPFSTDTATFTIPTLTEHWTRIDVNSIRTARWMESHFSDEFATRLLVQIESFKDHTTLLWRGNDVANNRREAEALLNRRRTRHSASAFASSPTPVPPPAPIPASLKRGRENEDKSKDVEKLTLTISNLRESKYCLLKKHR